MALLIISAGALADSRMRTVRISTLLAAVGVLSMVGLLGSLALGFHLGSTSLVGIGVPGFTQLDATQPGNRALIRQIGELSGRLIRLEAEASRLAARVSASPARIGRAISRPVERPVRQAGGPLLEPLFYGGPGPGVSLLQLDRDLTGVETNLDFIAATVARHDLDGMAFPCRAPIPGAAVSSGFGRRLDPFTGRLARHTGIDYQSPYGTPVVASAGGRVRYAGPHGAYGKTVEIDHGKGLVTRYGHLSRILVRAGDILLPGQQIATVGSTGRSTGPHLHFEILREGQPVQPGPYLSGAEFGG